MTRRRRDEAGKPSLPEGADRAPETVAWFESWRGSPATDGWDARQWQYMFDTALVHNMVYAYQELEQLPELERRLRFMGLSFGVDGAGSTNVPRFV